MVYLVSFKKYLITFLITLGFFLGALLFYLLALLLYMKFRGETPVLLQAFRDYAWLLLASLPFAVAVASSFYFAFLGNDKRFSMRMVPIVALFNAVLLLLFFVVKGDFRMLERPKQFVFRPEVADTGMMNVLGDYKIFLEKGDKKLPRRAVLFYKNAYLLSYWKEGSTSFSAVASYTVGRDGLSPASRSFSIPAREPVVILRDTGIARGIIDYYSQYLKRLKTIFQRTFAAGGPIAAVIALFLLSIGYFGLLSSVASFFNNKQTLILSYSAVFTVGLLFFAAFPDFLSLIAVISFGIKLPFLKVLIPGIFVGLLASLAAFGLYQFRDLWLKRSGNR